MARHSLAQQSPLEQAMAQVRLALVRSADEIDSRKPRAETTLSDGASGGASLARLLSFEAGRRRSSAGTSEPTSRVPLDAAMDKLRQALDAARQTSSHATRPSFSDAPERAEPRGRGQRDDFLSAQDDLPPTKQGAPADGLRTLSTAIERLEAGLARFTRPASVTEPRSEQSSLAKLTERLPDRPPNEGAERRRAQLEELRTRHLEAIKTDLGEARKLLGQLDRAAAFQ
jgi:hypothetical protein